MIKRYKKIEKRLITVKYISTNDQFGDILSKLFYGERFVKLTNSLNFREVEWSGLTFKYSVGDQCPAIPSL